MSPVQLARRLNELVRSALWVKSGLPFPFSAGEEDIQRIKIHVRGSADCANGRHMCGNALHRLGFVFPVSSGVGDLFDFLAVASGMFVIGLLDDG
jgi:hypothetical protein